MWLISWPITPSSSSRFMIASNPVVNRDRRLLSARAGGEGIGRWVVDDVDLRHRQPIADRERGHDVVGAPVPVPG